MSGLAPPRHVLPVAAAGERRSFAYLVAAGLAALLLAMILVAATTLSGSRSSDTAARAHAELLSRLPSYWTVHSGETYEVIAQKTGLDVNELETFNPYVDPSAIVPGQRLKLHLHVAPPKPRPPGPRFYRIRNGDSFDSIARRTHHSAARLQRLNPKLSPVSLRPGRRLRLR